MKNNREAQAYLDLTTDELTKISATLTEARNTLTKLSDKEYCLTDERLPEIDKSIFEALRGAHVIKQGLNEVRKAFDE